MAAALALGAPPSAALIMTILGVAGWLGLCGAGAVLPLDCSAFCCLALASWPSIIILLLSDTTGGF